MKKLNAFLFFALLIGFVTPSLSSEPLGRNMVFIYDDEGVNQEFLMHTKRMCTAHLDEDYRVESINATAIRAGAWTKDAALLILPGGIASPYAKKLQGQGNDQIKRFVAEGGSYLGLCAGAYYASSYVEYDKGGPTEVIAERELKFFKGKSVGPLRQLTPENGGHCSVPLVTLYLKDTVNASLFYRQGCSFEINEAHNDVKVIGRYDEGLPALIHMSHGLGQVILSGVHFEFDPFLFDEYQSTFPEIIHQLKQDNEVRQSLIYQVFQILGLQTMEYNHSKF